MKVKITEAALENLDLNPATTEAEVAQNVMALAITPQGSVPLERGMGVPMAYLHRGMPAAAAVFESELTDALAEWEDRATLTGSTYYGDQASGLLRADVEVKISE